MHKNFPHSGGMRFWAGSLPPKALNYIVQNKQKNETTAGVALVLAAAVGFTMHVGHKLLGEEGVGELHQHLVAPVPDRRPAAQTPPMLLPEATTPWSSFSL